MAKAVFGIAKSESQAITIADNLKAAGFAENDVSVLFPDTKGTKEFAHEQHTKAPEGAAAATGAAGGAALGGAFGGAASGAAAGGLTGALIDMGIPEYEAKRYEQKVKDGNILMSVHTEDIKERERAREIFVKGGADDISSYR
jgi:uncharacterized membrane protein